MNATGAADVLSASLNDMDSVEAVLEPVVLGGVSASGEGEAEHAFVDVAESGETEESLTSFPGAVKDFLLKQFGGSPSSVDSPPPNRRLSRKSSLIISPPTISENVQLADVPPLPPAPADVPPTPDGMTPFSQPPRPHFNMAERRLESGGIVRSPIFRGSPLSSSNVNFGFSNPSSAPTSPMRSLNRVVAFNLPASNRPISPQSTSRWSDQRRKGYAAFGSPGSGSLPSQASSADESFASSIRVAAAVAAARTSSRASPSLNVGGASPVRSPQSPGNLSSGGLSSRASSSGLAHSGLIKVGSIRGDSEDDSAEVIARLTPILFAAVRHNKFETVEKLVTDLPGLVDAVDETTKNNSLLHVACSNGYARIARFLIKCGINIDATNLDGNTPLHLCYQYGRNQLVSILISQNANENARNRKDQIPAQLLSGSIPASAGTSPATRM